MFSALILYGLSPVFSSMGNSLLPLASMMPRLFLDLPCTLTAHHPAINVGPPQAWAPLPHSKGRLSSWAISSIALASVATMHQWPLAVDLQARPLLFAPDLVIWSSVLYLSFNSQKYLKFIRSQTAWMMSSTITTTPLSSWSCLLQWTTWATIHWCGPVI